MDRRDSQGQVEQRRQVDHERHPNEQRPADHGIGQDHRDLGTEQSRDEPARAEVSGTEGECDRRTQCEEGRGEEREQQVLRHVDAEGSLRVGVDRRGQGERDADQPGEERDRGATRMRGSGARRSAKAHRVQPCGGHDRHDRQRVQRPRGQDGRGSGIGRDGREHHRHMLARSEWQTRSSPARRFANSLLRA